MRAFSLVATFVAMGVAAPVVFAAPSDAAKAREQFCEFYLGTAAAPGGNVTLKSSNEPSPEVARAKHFAETLRPDGSWADLDYASQAHSGWPPDTHWTRTLAIVAAARWPGGGATNRPGLEAAAHRAIAYWIQHDFICPNWWYNQIGVPQQAATVALLLGDALTAGEKHYMIGTLMPRAKIGMTGQNRVWLAGNTLMFGLVDGNEAAVAEAARTIWSEVAVTTAEGIQPDFSFHQHGPQQQFGNYGMALAVEVCRWATVLRGTPWAMPADRLATYRGFLLDGEAWVVWRLFMDVSACDRQLMPRSQQTKAFTIERVMRNAAQFDPAYASAYSGFVQRNRDPHAANDLVGNRIFWRSDYVIHRRPEFAATLKLSSRRVVGAEMVNTENILGYHEGDGAMYLYRRGDEYADIFPVWDWQKLPGITCAQRRDGPPPYQQVRGERDFVGGVSDGQDGCAVLDFARTGVTAHKGWFFAGDTIVCLGAAIESRGADPVITCLNQCLLRGAVTVKRGGEAPAPFTGDARAISDVEWVEHDGWRYAFPVPTTVRVQAGPQTGNWSRVFRNPDTPKADVTRDVFALWIDHPKTGGAYAYVVSKAGTTAPTTIVKNGAAAQAVQLSAAKFAVAFWSAGELRLAPDLTVAADHAATVVLDASRHRLFAADPTQQLKELAVTVNGVRHAVSLPVGGGAGRTVSATW